MDKFLEKIILYHCTGVGIENSPSTVRQIGVSLSVIEGYQVGANLSIKSLRNARKVSFTTSGKYLAKILIFLSVFTAQLHHQPKVTSHSLNLIHDTNLWLTALPKYAIQNPPCCHHACHECIFCQCHQ